MKKVLVVLMIVLVSSLALAACTETEPEPEPQPTPAPEPEPGKTYELKLSTWIPPMALPAAAMIDPWIAEIGEKTGGRVEITHYSASSLGAQDDHYSMVVNRQADIVLSGGQAGVMLRNNVSALPFLYTSAEMGGWVHWKLMEKYMMDTDLKDVKPLWLIPVAPDNLCNNGKQVKSMEDLKGLKLATGQDIGLDTLEALGATATYIPSGEMYTALETGIVDGLATNWEKAFIFHEFEVTKYRTGNINMWVNIMPMYMNLDAWNELPEDIKKVFDETTGLAFSQRCGAMFDEEDQKFLGIIGGHDAEVGNPPVYYITDDERERWVEATTVVRDDWIEENEDKGIPAKDILEEAYALAKEFAK